MRYLDTKGPFFQRARTGKHLPNGAPAAGGFLAENRLRSDYGFRTGDGRNVKAAGSLKARGGKFLRTGSRGVKRAECGKIPFPVREIGKTNRLLPFFQKYLTEIPQQFFGKRPCFVVFRRAEIRLTAQKVFGRFLSFDSAFYEKKCFETRHHVRAETAEIKTKAAENGRDVSAAPRGGRGVFFCRRKRTAFFKGEGLGERLAIPFETRPGDRAVALKKQLSGNFFRRGRRKKRANSWDGGKFSACRKTDFAGKKRTEIFVFLIGWFIFSYGCFFCLLFRRGRAGRTEKFGGQNRKIPLHSLDKRGVGFDILIVHPYSITEFHGKGNPGDAAGEGRRAEKPAGLPVFSRAEKQGGKMGAGKGIFRAQFVLSSGRARQGKRGYPVLPCGEKKP